MELSNSVYPYLYNYAEYTQNLFDILSYQAKMACFFKRTQRNGYAKEVVDVGVGRDDAENNFKFYQWKTNNCYIRPTYH